MEKNGRKKIRLMKKIFILLISLFIISCSGNGIYFSIEEKAIISCHDSLLSKLSIEGINENHDYFRIVLKEERNGIGVLKLHLNSISDEFDIYNSLGKKVDRSEYKLKPSSKYLISHFSKGDAAASEIIVTTDKNGNIVNADKLDCN